MKIAIALGGTDFGRSGIGVYVRAVVPALHAHAAARGDDIVLVGTPRDVASIGEGHLASKRLAPVWDAPAASAAFYLSGGADRAARAAGADVLLLPAANRRAQLFSSLPTVAVVHDLGQLHVADKYDSLRMAYAKHALRAALPSATELVAISGATKKDIVSFLGVPAERVLVVANGVDRERFRPLERDGAEARGARTQFDLASPYLLYVSRLEHPGKNHIRLVEAFASTSARERFTLALAGGDWGAEAMIRERARDLGVASRVRFLGFVPDASVPGLYAGAASVLMVGLAEGFGLPALEALSMGIPVVASTTGALPEVVGDLGVMCDPYDVASIRAALERVVADAHHASRVRSEGPLHAATRGWDATASGLYDACVSAATRAARARRAA